MIKRFIAAIAGFVLLGLIIALIHGSGSYKQVHEEKVRAGDISIVQNAAFYYAVDRGLFQEEGLDVEVVKFDSPKQVVDAVVLNQVDFGGTGSAAGISAIAESNSPSVLKYYSLLCMGENGEEGNHLLVKKGSLITSINQLEGKKIGFLPGPQWKTIVKKILSNNGVKLENTSLIELPAQLQLASLSSGAIDALISLEPVGTIALENGVASVLESSPANKNIASPFCGGAGIISAKFLKERPEAAKKVLKAMKKAVDGYNQKKPPGILVKFLKVDEKIAPKVQVSKAVFYTDLTEAEKIASQKFLDLFFDEKVMPRRVIVEDVLVNG